MALPLAELLYIYFKEHYSMINFDFIIPIPLYKKRKKQRGYNQAALLAENLSKKTNIEMSEDLLIRFIKTPPLYDLNREKRMSLINGVFSVNNDKKYLLNSKNILLIDDIFTTGTTTNEAAYTLKKEAKVKNVYVLTLSTSRVEGVVNSSFPA